MIATTTASQAATDSAPIRPGEELDESKLRAYLQTHLPAHLPFDALEGHAPFAIRQFPGGHSNLTYCVRFGGHEFVLRRPPFGPVPPTAHDMPREFRLLSAIHPVFALAPKPYLLCENTDIIGAPFYVMERRAGVVVRQQNPPEIGADLSLRRRVGESLVDTLAQLHAVDIEKSGLSNIGKPAGFVRRQVEGWANRWERSKTTDLNEMSELAVWLRANLPAEPARHTLVHNDYKLDNVILDPAEPDRVVAVLDWEMCTVGDPLVDLGILLCYWPEAGDVEGLAHSLSPVTSEPGWLTRAEIIERYTKRSGTDTGNIAYYYILAMFKLAVVLQQIYYRYHAGQTRDERFKNFEQRVIGLAQTAYTLMKQQ